MKPRLTAITIGVDDLQRSLAFYRDGLGLPTNGIMGAEYEHGAVAFFELQNGLILALWERKNLAWDAGIAQSAPSPTELSLGHNVNSRDGAGPRGRRAHHQRGAGDLLGRLRRLLPGPGRPPLGSALESATARP